ncbi:MAG: arabinofuranosidase catalytic domain-containing protein [Chitinophagaceae bacterium]
MKKKNLFMARLTLSLLPIAILMMPMAVAGNNIIPPRPKGPCDIYAAAGYPCVAAHSTTRALSASYNGPLYQVMRQSDGKTLDIGVVQPGKDDPGGYADAAAQDVFCANTIGWITKIYDQSGNGNHLMQAPPGTFKGPAKGEFNTLPIADMAPVTLNGHKVYGVYIMPGMGLRNNNATGIAINDEPEGIYYVVNGKHFDSGCCFDYGNSSTNSRAVGTGTMETTYFGTATAWGSGNGSGPWIMADMEAGLFSGFNAKKNDVPVIDSWRFVSAFVDGGGGNKWDLRGGNAQEGKLTTYYSGVRPGTPNSAAYYPMSKKGGILLGNGGDNGNGSAGTFYEGIMTTGFPSEVTTDAVQVNIAAAKYDVQRLSLSRLTTFTPKSAQDVTLTFTNTTGMPVTDVKLSITTRPGWTVQVQGSAGTSKTFTASIAPHASVSATFKVGAPAITDAGFLNGKVEWINATSAKKQTDVATQRIRNVSPVKINEVRFNTGNNPTNQFIELYNASAGEIDISDYTLISTPGGWTSVKLAKISANTKLAPNGFYLFGLAGSGLVAPANAGDTFINVRSTAGFEVGHQVNIDGELKKITRIGTPASPMTTLFIPVSTGPWLSIPAGATNIPVTNATGFTIGQKIGIDIGGKYEVAIVTTAGKAATQTNLAVAAKAGDNTIKVADNSNMTVGDVLTISTGAKKEVVKIKRIGTIYTAPPRGDNFGPGGEVELTASIKFDHMQGVDVSDPGTGISFSPATRFVHKSGDAVQALGSGITIEGELAKKHETGAPVINTQNTSTGYQGSQRPDQWYGIPLSVSAGSLALMDAKNIALVDGMVYGSRQSNSSANGPITSPEIATLEGEQTQGGCIVVVPLPRGFQRPASSNDQTNKSYGRFPDGFDKDINCTDFVSQNAITLAAASAAGSNNIKVGSVADFAAGQRITIGAGANSETIVITNVGTAGATATSAASNAGTTIVPVRSATGFAAGQTITIGSGANFESAVIGSIIARRRFGNAANNSSDSIIISTPLKNTHTADEQVSGSGINLSAALTKTHSNGEPVASDVPTPGKPNQYARKPD